MKRTAQHDAGDDDHNRSARNPSVRVSSGLVAMNQAAAPDNDNDRRVRRRIPRVIRNAVDGAWERPPHAGYSPAVPLQMAGAYRWARYDDVVSALRCVHMLSLLIFEVSVVLTKTPIRDGDTPKPVYDLHMPPVTITLVFSHVNLTHNNNIVTNVYIGFLL
jgi:hypothetical protein